MIENSVILKIQELLSTGKYSQREIGRRLGVSNTTVSHVFQAKRKTYTDASEYRVEEPEGPVVRCPVCGGKTRLPCVYCRVTELLKAYPKTPARAEQKSGAAEFRIELAGEHLARYEKIRDWRARQPNPHFIDIPDDWPWRNISPDRNSTQQEARS